MQQADRAPGDRHVHVAMPRLAGLPAYGRPPRPVVAAPRGFDPDDLPLEAYRTDDDRASLAQLETSDPVRDGTTRA